MSELKIAQDNKKFNSDGNALAYYGNTIISLMNTKDWPVQHLSKEIQEKMQKKQFSKKIAFLPLESLHMTVFTLLRERDRGTKVWPTYIDMASQFSEIDDILYKKWQEVPKFRNIQMKIDRVKLTGIQLSPLTPNDERILADYREKISEVTGIKHKNHYNYIFHVTIGYKIEDLNKHETEEAIDFCNVLTEKAKNSYPSITVPEPDFTIFNDMLSYSTDLNQRGNLF